MTSQPFDIRCENLISKHWDFVKNPAREFKRGILITGASSFIGCHIAEILQTAYDGEIHLLVRAPNDYEAVSRMQQSFIKWDLGFFDENRFFIHRGDVCLDSMGLKQAEYRRLSRSVGQVIHLAMTPMYHLPYQHFKRIWVPELERMIGFCSEPEERKFLHYASSYNANFFVTDDDFQALNTNAWQSGYAGFKWVARESLHNAMKQGLAACIYDIPLVLGSEKNGICPSHYSIWMILDIFLKTGLFIPFSFRIIPVDVLAHIFVLNAIKVLEGKPAGFLRPLLAEPVDDALFERTAANLLGLKQSQLERLREACQNKLRFDFMMPSNFYQLLDKVNHLPAIFPEWYDKSALPLTPMVFISNLNAIMALKTA